MRKCKCGNDVANNAKACPKCGHRFTSSVVKLLAWFFGIVFGIGLLGTIVGSNSTTPVQPAPTPAQKAADEKQEAAFQRAVAGAKQLRDSMRNPDSFNLAQVLVMEDGAVCYEYRAQNGFGGMNASSAVLAPSGKFKTAESNGFTALWNKECGRKTGFDKTWEVGYAAGFHGMFDSK